jgi:hypothetical protein
VDAGNRVGIVGILRALYPYEGDYFRRRRDEVQELRTEVGSLGKVLETPERLSSPITTVAVDQSVLTLDSIRTRMDLTRKSLEQLDSRVRQHEDDCPERWTGWKRVWRILRPLDRSKLRESVVRVRARLESLLRSVNLRSLFQCRVMLDNTDG